LRTLQNTIGKWPVEQAGKKSKDVDAHVCGLYTGAI
jgi:hypothetical protein